MKRKQILAARFVFSKDFNKYNRQTWFKPYGVVGVIHSAIRNVLDVSGHHWFQIKWVIKIFMSVVNSKRILR